jgi:YHS domain-containing protein
MKRATATIVLVAVLAFITMTAFAQAKKVEKAKDPVCGLMVDKDPQLSVSHKGEVFYFCSRADMEEFKKNPQKYEKNK